MTTTAQPGYDVVIVGAGFAGLYMLRTARAMGLSAHVYEAGDGVGGTWHWNRYPGARCDFESLDYSFSFDRSLEQDWDWSERYATQPEILRYLDHVADRYDLRRDISLNVRVAGARFDEDARVWTLRDQDGPLAAARHVVMATGSLSAPRYPDIPGIETFAGRRLHTGAWPRQPVDFTGRRVAVVGVGSSGVQVSVEIAKQAAHLYVMQRTPSYVVPARHEPLDHAALAQEKGRYPARRALNRAAALGVDFAMRPEPTMSVSEAERVAEYDRRWPIGGAAMLQAFPDLATDLTANATLAAYLKARVRAVVRDQRTAELLTSMDYPVGARRLVVGPGFHEMFNQPHVELVDVKGAPITEITPDAIQTTAGRYQVEDIVFATGFDAVTGALLAIDVTGRGGRSLAEHWAAGPLAYLGLQSAGFPNMFFVNGPGSPSVVSNMVLSLEQHVDFIAKLIAAARQRGASTVEPTAEAEAGWVRHVSALAAKSLFMTTDSWYLGSNVPGKPRVFSPYVGGVPAYRETCERIAADGFRGLVFG